MKFRAARRSVEVTVEKTETYTIKRSLPIDNTWCYECESLVKMTNTETAARITGIRQRDIYSRIEDGRTHFVESEDGAVTVCLRSLGQKRLADS